MGSESRRRTKCCQETRSTPPLGASESSAIAAYASKLASHQRQTIPIIVDTLVKQDSWASTICDGGRPSDPDKKSKLFSSIV